MIERAQYDVATGVPRWSFHVDGVSYVAVDGEWLAEPPPAVLAVVSNAAAALAKLAPKPKAKAKPKPKT